jgi:signal transduction histidine kinase
VRLARQVSLLLLISYLLAVVAIGWWARRTFDATTRRAMEDTARLVATEVAAALDEGVVAELLEGNPENRLRLLNQVFDVTRRSTMVRSLEVVDRSGEVFASGQFEAVGRQLPAPAAVFAGGREPRLLSEQGDGREPEAWVLAMPLERDGELLGYLRVGLDATPVAGLYDDLRRGLLQAGLFGLLVVAALAVALHYQLHRRSAELVAVLESAAGGSGIEAGGQERADEFGPAFAAAGRLGRELQQERSRSEQADRRLHRLAQGMDVGVVLLGRDRNVEFATERAARLVGLAADAPPEDWRQALAPVDELLEGILQTAPADRLRGGQRDVEVPRPGQPPRRVRFQVYPLDEQGNAGFLVQARDRDLLQSIEIDLRMAAQLRALNRLYRGVAHDLRAPLNAMVLNLELLRRSLDPSAPPREGMGPKQQRWVEIIDQELHRLRRALDILLAQTAPAAEKPETFDLRGVIEEISELLYPQARQQKVELASELPEQSVVVTAYRDQIKQAVLNLSINGLEAMPEGGTLRLSVTSEGATASMRVADSGPGIPPELRDRIFDMHFTTKQSGTGIGLYVTRSIFEAQGGTVRIESTGPEGTTFQLTLPTTEQGEL